MSKEKSPDNDIFDPKEADPGAVNTTVVVDAPAAEVDMAALKAEMKLDILKLQADQLDVTYHPAIGIDKLQAKVAAAIIANTAPPEPVKVIEPVVESPIARNARLRKEAFRLVRVVVNNMNPIRTTVEGEYLTAGNSVVGSITKYVPFHVEAGFHIPHIIYEQLRDRMCQTFHTVKDRVTGVESSKTRLIHEFNIIILPPLTEEEMKELARRQAASHSID